jgi:hypothetical protein
MSRLIKVVYDVAEIRGRYLRVHDELFHLSARKLVRILNAGRREPYADQTVELARLLERLHSTQRELDCLIERDLEVRRGREIHSKLTQYVAALSETVTILKSISERMQQRSARDREALQSLKISYDDAMQYHNHLGAELNSLISTL